MPLLSVSGNNYAQLSGNVLKATAEGTVTVKAVSNYNNNCYATKRIEIEKAAVQEQAPMVPGTPLAKPVKISMQLQMGQYEWSADTTHAYDIWADGQAVHGFSKEKKELTITKAGRYVGITSASYYVGDTTVTMADGDVQVYVIDVANDGSVTVYDGKVKINYAERTTSVVDTTYANVEKTDDGYFLSFKEDGTGNAGTRIANK